MFWTARQHRRILDEKEILSIYFPGRVTWLDGLTKVDVKMTTNDNNDYKLRVYLPEDHPNSVPDLVITESTMPLPSWENNGLTHTLKRRDGCLTICHYRASRWNPQEQNLYDVFMKGRLWLEAFEAHLRTSLPMGEFLKEMEIM